ncbi:MAG: formyltransferase family protein [Clostridia bacterium]
MGQIVGSADETPGVILRMRAAVLVSGGGTNLQALLDAQKAGQIPGVGVCPCHQQSKAGVHALRGLALAGIEGVYLPTVRYENREEYHMALRDLLLDHHIDVILLAGFLVVLGKLVMEDCWANL